MIMVNRAAILAASLGLGMVPAAPAAAQGISRTWVAANGDNANSCTEALPCRTFQRAINRTIDGGEVNCLDSGGFGPATITKSISLICDKTEAGIIGTSQGLGIAGSPDIIVVISGVDFEGLGQSGSPGQNGIIFVSGGALHVRHAKFRGFRSGYGIFFAPISNAQLMIDDVVVSEGGCPCTGNTGGIGIYPAPGVTVQASIFNTQSVNNLNAGLRIDTSSVTGATVNAVVANSRFAHNGTGILVKSPAGTGAITLMLMDSVLALNNGYGLIVNGPGVTARAGNTTVTANGTGLLINGGATLSSYGTNQLDGNTINGSFSSPLIPRK
jgi:hypothetical protein